MCKPWKCKPWRCKPWITEVQAMEVRCIDVQVVECMQSWRWRREPNVWCEPNVGQSYIMEMAKSSDDTDH